MAERIVVNAKVPAPGRVQRDRDASSSIAPRPQTFLPRLAADAAGGRVELRGDDAARALAPDVKPAGRGGLGTPSTST